MAGGARRCGHVFSDFRDLVEQPVLGALAERLRDTRSKVMAKLQGEGRASTNYAATRCQLATEYGKRFLDFACKTLGKADIKTRRPCLRRGQ
eukprot:12965972-Alexandrium_andersonii.AAC.1